MQAPICINCLSSENLCENCAAKLGSGEISKDDVEVSRQVFALRDTARSVMDAKLLRVLNRDAVILVAAPGDGAKLVGKGGAVVKALAKQYNKSIKVLEQSEFKEFISNLLQPLTVMGFNTYYTTDGEIQRIMIPASQKPKQHISSETVSEVASKVYNKNVEIVFDENL